MDRRFALRWSVPLATVEYNPAKFSAEERLGHIYTWLIAAKTQAKIVVPVECAERKEAPFDFAQDRHRSRWMRFKPHIRVPTLWAASP